MELKISRHFNKTTITFGQPDFSCEFSNIVKYFNPLNYTH